MTTMTSFHRLANHLDHLVCVLVFYTLIIAITFADSFLNIISPSFSFFVQLILTLDDKLS